MAKLKLKDLANFDKLKSAGGAVIYPHDIAEKLAPKKITKNIYNGKGGIKRQFLGVLTQARAKSGIGLDTKNIKKSIYKTIDRLEKSKNPEIDFTKNLTNTVQNTIAFDIANTIKETAGETTEKKRIKAVWLPSEAEEPDPEHILNYGEEFYLDEGINGEIPAERFGCKCGMRIID